MKLIIVLLLFALTQGLFAQSQSDSLRKACTSGNDSLRTDAYLQLAKLSYVQFGNLDSLISNSQKALSITEKTKISTQVYQAKKQIATGFVLKVDSARALLSLNAVLNEARWTKDSIHITDVLHMYAVLYGNLGYADTSLSYLIREAEVATAIGYYNSLAIAYSCIAWIYRGRQQFDKMLYYHRKSLSIVDKMESTNLGNIIQVYVMASQGYMLSGQKFNDNILIDSAKVLADSVMSMALRLNRLPPQASAYWVYSQHALYNGTFNNAENFALKALEYRNYIENRSVMIMYTTVAIANANLKNGDRALLYLDSAKHSSALSELYYRNHLAETEWSIYSLLGNYQAALKAHELYLVTKDSLDNISATLSINEIEQAFHKNENEREIQRLAQEQEISSLNNKLLTAGIAAAALLALLVFLFYRQRNLRSEQNRLLIEQRLNRARMDPHFLFNTFTALQGLALKEKDPVKTAGFLSDYSVIMRQTLESTFSELISIEDEVSYLEKYLSLQQMRMAGKFDFSISVVDDIDPTELQVPGMIIQPFIENSIEHGIAGLSHQGQLHISFENQGKELKITITDNGSGFASNKQDKKYPSRATGIIKDRLFLLNKKYKANSRYDLVSASSGVTVTIYLPQLK